MIKRFTFLLVIAVLSAFHANAQQGFNTITNLTPEPITANSGEKPQSKPWNYEGKWWAVFPNSNGTHLWRLDGVKWTNVLKLSSRTTSKADCKLYGNITHILLYQGPSSQMVSVEFDNTTGTYKLWSKRTSTVGLSLDRGVETATIDIDSQGRMWLASAGSADINVRWSDSPYTNWSAPITIATGVDEDDICAVIALPGKIGVMWSNQNTQRFGFRTHIDGAGPTSWTNDEVPASQSALNAGHGMADDHINLAAASDGTLYCAVKTEYDLAGYPRVALLVRKPTGEWHDLYNVAGLGTRPIVILNEALGKLKVIYTARDSGGNIYYKETATSNISFGPQLTLMSGTFNNATSSKDNYTSEIVVLASNSSNMVGVLATDGTVTTPNVPAAPSLATPTNNATNTALPVTIGWHSVSGADSYQAQVSTSSGFTSTVYNSSGLTSTSVSVAGLANNTTYYWRARATNSSGTGNWSSSWSFTTAAGETTTSTLAAHWKMDEGSGTHLADATGNGNHASTINSPVWVTGTSGTGLKLNGSNQFAKASNSSSLNITGNITIAFWMKPEKNANQYVVHKAVNNTVDGYEVSLTSAGLILFRFNQATSGEIYRVNSANTYPTDGATWIHVAATYDGTVARLYVNGALNRTKTFSSPPPIASNNVEVGIGAQSDGFRSFKGSLDDVRIYNTALSDSEISQLASSGFTSTSPTLLTAIDEPENDLIAYPNPFTANAVIRFVLPEGGSYNISLYDSKGTLVRVLKQDSAAAGIENTIDLDGSALANGLYFIRLQTNKEAKTIKLLRQQ